MLKESEGNNDYPVAFYSAYTMWGGAEVYLESVLRARRARGLKSVLFCPPDYPLLRSERIPDRCRVITTRNGTTSSGGGPRAENESPGSLHSAVYRAISPGSVRFLTYAFSRIRALTGFFSPHRPRLLHFNDTGAEPAPIAAKLAGVRTTSGTLHTLPRDPSQDFTAAHRALQVASVRSLDALVAVSEFTKKAWIQTCGVPENRIRVIHNGIDIDRFRPRRPARTVRRELGIPPHSPVVGVTSRLHPRKGHRNLLAMIPDAHLVVTGDGKSAEPLQREAARLGLQRSTHFLGTRRDVADVTQVYDVAVLPSERECFPFALLEAMALGKPVVAWKVGGVPELVRDGVDGRVVPFGRDSRFVEAVRQLLADEGMARRCGAEAAERVSKHFTYRRMVNKTLAFHRELLQRGRIGRE